MADESAKGEWLRRVLHDLVKYLEMMPRSMDWDHLEEEDAELIHEAVFATRRSRQGVESAREIWHDRLESMPPGTLPDAQVTRLSAALDALEVKVRPLDCGSLSGADTEAIRQLIFAIGDDLRAALESLGEV